ncbi:tyrosine-type recombinase/integrase [Planctomycetaceae bacterium SH248]
MRYAKTYYSKNGVATKELGAMRDIVKTLSARHGVLLASTFGPKVLKEFRSYLVSTKLCRNEVNKRVGRVVRIFKWAASEELIGGEQYHALQSVDGLKYGRTDARESEPVKPVDDVVALKTAEYASPVVSAMIQLQLLTGMRPGEVTQMRLEDIDRSENIWFYRADEHKNKWRGHDRVVALGPQCQQVLLPLIEGRETGYLFSPADSERQRHQLRQMKTSSTRKTKIYPSEVKSRERRIAERVEKTKRWGARYDTDSYRRAVSYAIKRARKSGENIPHWHPHQIRHTFATKVRKSFGAEGVQAGLGHANLNLVEVYAEKNQQLLRQIAERMS